LLVTLSLLGSREAIEGVVGRVVDFPIAGTASGITLGGVIGFFVILVGGYALSSAIRFLLREEVLSRFHLSRGLPELLSTTLHYLLLVLIFLYAVKVGQIELNRFTVLTGALGVGVGFGLQNIINNFVSGLILQFERPIHIGDVLELEAGAAGTVTRIGIRSSTILTAQGAEIIVPNSNFISNRVTNWTLTEAERRVDIPIGVAYGTDLKLVMGLLNEAAATHPDVLTQPAPVAYFKQFGDSSLDFELQFWVMMQSNWVRVRSEVLSSVLRSLDKAGIEIPFPQRDLRLRSIDGTAAEILTGSDIAALSRPDKVIP
jgi:small-conductance mechanosensitive channel